MQLKNSRKAIEDHVLKMSSSTAPHADHRTGAEQPLTHRRFARRQDGQNRNRIMDLHDLVAPEGVIAHLKATSKKQALQELAAKAAKVTGLDERKIFETLLERERLGSTGVGHGIAIPHGKLASLDRLHGLFARLDHPIDFDSVDEKPVDLIFLLLAPESAGADHLKALARVSRLLRNQQMTDKLRATETNEALYALLTEPSASATSAA